MKKFIRIAINLLAFMLPIVALGTIGYFSNLSLPLSKLSNLDIPRPLLTASGGLTAQPQA